MKRCVVVGLGGRASMFVDYLTEHGGDKAQLVAVCESNAGRLKQAHDELGAKVPGLKAYSAEQFDQMISEVKPHAVVVTTPDCLHDHYICRALRAGCDAITEKPMTTDEEKCQEIIDTVAQTGKSVRVTFNYRYSPPRTRVKELLMEGVIGKVLSVDFKWLLDTSHGADYFRRWHRFKNNSGGLMVHKATHHFDLVNWWISSPPASVTAFGDRVFYNSKQAERYGLKNRSERCQGCPEAGNCNFYLDIADSPTMKKLYFDNEKHDGYLRDRCVFGDDITIEDTMNLSVRYRSGVFMSYSLTAFSPWEGYTIAFNGTKGRLEHVCCETSYVSGDGSVQGAFKPGETTITVYPHFKDAYSIEVPEGKGGHGGGDAVLLQDLFGEPKADPLLRSASHVQGAYSILTGIAANKAMRTGEVVCVDDLVSGLGDPGYTEMPGEDESIPYTPKTKK